LLSTPTAPFVRVLLVALGAVTMLAGCSGGSSAGGTPPTVPAGSADASGWSKESVAAIRAVGHKLAQGFPGECTKFNVTPRSIYIKGLKKVGGPYPEAVGSCDLLTEDAEISEFPSGVERDDFVDSRTQKLCEISKQKNVGLPGLYWVVGGNWSAQPDSEGVARRIAHVLNAKYEATGCNGTNPGWDPSAVASLEQTASKLETNRQGCADIEMQDRDLVSKTPPYDKLGTPAATANCSLKDNSSIVLSAYNTPADKTDALIRGEMSRECSTGNPIRVVRTGDVALFASTPAIAEKVKSAVGGSISPLACAKK
jgi:hypothetical protein